MKLVRFGAIGAEKPGILDAEGQIRDLSAHIDDINGFMVAFIPLGNMKIHLLRIFKQFVGIFKSAFFDGIHPNDNIRSKVGPCLFGGAHKIADHITPIGFFKISKGTHAHGLASSAFVRKVPIIGHLSQFIGVVPSCLQKRH